jgi:hypothetical protein
MAGAFQRQGFDGLGQCEQEDHHGGFRPAANEQRAAHRQRHQKVDVEREVPQRDPALFQGGQAAGEDGHHGQQRAQGMVLISRDPGGTFGGHGGHT